MKLQNYEKAKTLFALVKNLCKNAGKYFDFLRFLWLEKTLLCSVQRACYNLSWYHFAALSFFFCLLLFTCCDCCLANQTKNYCYTSTARSMLSLEMRP